MKFVGSLQLLPENRRFLINLENVYSLGSYAKEAKTRKEQNKYVDEIIRQLCESPTGLPKWKVKEKNRKDLNKVMKEYGLLEQKKPTGDPLSRLNEFVDYISAATNKTPYELKSNLTANELARWGCKVILKDLRKAQDMIFAQHSPKEFNKDLRQKIRSLEAKTRVIAEGKQDKITNEIKGRVIKLKHANQYSG